MLKRHLLFNIYTREICEEFVYKHSENILKISLPFKKFTNFRDK